jgi:phosphomannomutase
MVGLMVGPSPNGCWTIFTGDQLGTLFAHWILNIYRSSGKPIHRLAMVASTVSSKMIGAIAAMEGFKFVESLTGLFMPSYFSNYS